jgi:hypothetical protein
MKHENAGIYFVATLACMAVGGLGCATQHVVEVTAPMSPRPDRAYVYGRFELVDRGGTRGSTFVEIDFMCVNGDNFTVPFLWSDALQVFEIRPATCFVRRIGNKIVPWGKEKRELVTFKPGVASYLGDLTALAMSQVQDLGLGKTSRLWQVDIYSADRYDDTTEAMRTTFGNFPTVPTRNTAIGKGASPEPTPGPRP